MTHEAAKRTWLTVEEIIKTDTDTLRALYSKALLHMSSMQRDLVTYMLEGSMSDAEAARKAGYSVKDTNPGWRARKTKAVIHALSIGREIYSREAETTPGWVRSELKALMERAKDEGDNQTIIACAREFCKIDGMYAAEQMKLLHANHEGGALEKDITDEEWLTLAALNHDIRNDEKEDRVH